MNIQKEFEIAAKKTNLQVVHEIIQTLLTNLEPQLTVLRVSQYYHYCTVEGSQIRTIQFDLRLIIIDLIYLEPHNDNHCPDEVTN